jgi:hypothetical protein
MTNFLYFEYIETENAWTEKNNLIYIPTVYKKEITQAGYQAKQHPAQCKRTIKMKR